MSVCTQSTQTELNVELMMNFLRQDLPRLISMDVVPLVYKVVSGNGTGGVQLNKEIQQLIARLISENLPSPDVKPSTKHFVQEVKKGRNQGEIFDQMVAECPVCNFVFKTFTELTSHLEKTHAECKEDLTCKLCNVNTDNCKALASHIREAHIQGRGDVSMRISCKLCPSQFLSVSLRDRHMERHKKGGRISCKKCGITFTYSSQLRSHEQFSLTCGRLVKKDLTSQGEPPDRTSQNTNTKTSTPLKSPPAAASIVTSALTKALGLAPATVTMPLTTTPLATEGSNTPLKTDPFSIPPPAAAGLLTTSTGGGPRYQCRKCNRNYTSLSILLSHVREHDVERLFSCTRCHHRFTSYPALESHFYRIHRTNKVIPHRSGAGGGGDGVVAAEVVEAVVDGGVDEKRTEETEVDSTKSEPGQKRKKQKTKEKMEVEEEVEKGQEDSEESKPTVTEGEEVIEKKSPPKKKAAQRSVRGRRGGRRSSRRQNPNLVDQ